MTDTDMHTETVQPIDLLVVDERAIGDDVELGQRIGGAQTIAEYAQRLPVDERLAAPELDPQTLAIATLQPARQFAEKRLDIVDVALDLMRLARLVAVRAGVVAFEAHLDLEHAHRARLRCGIVRAGRERLRPIPVFPGVVHADGGEAYGFARVFPHQFRDVRPVEEMADVSIPARHGEPVFELFGHMFR